MSREAFVQGRQQGWRTLETLLASLEDGRAEPRRAAELPELHRRCCHDLALVRERRYGLDLEERLNDMAVRGHAQLHRRAAPSGRRVASFFAAGFPRAVRRDGRLFALAALLLFGPAAAMGALTGVEPDALSALLSPEAVAEFEDMYSAPKPMPRGAESDLAAFGFYVWNNVSIAFRTFAGGVLACVGTAFFLVHNGLVLGGVAAHLTRHGMGTAFWSFVVGHAALELTGIVVAGQAGLKLGVAVIAPGRRRRSDALREAAHSSLPLVLGAATLLLAAAVVEAFWSAASGIGPITKVAVGTALWLLVAAYLSLGGLGREA